MSKRNIASVIILLQLLVLGAKAGVLEFTSKIQGTTIVSGATLQTYDDQYADMTGVGTSTAWHADNINRSLSNYVHLRYTGAKTLPYGDWSVEVALTVNRWDEYGTALTAETCTLKVNYSATTEKYTDISTYKVTAPGNRMKITITGITYTGTGITVTPPDVMLENDITVDRIHTMDLSNGQYIATAVSGAATGCTTSNGDNLDFHWDYIPGADEYDFEWVFKSSYDSNTTPDFTNATRVTTSNQYYSISNSFDDGTVYYRFRGVGKDYSTGTLRMEGDWTPGDAGIVVYNIEKKNWAYSAAYAEDGKRKEVMSYFDGSTRNRQAVTLSNTENVGLVAENMYDYEGRPAVQTLPSPSADFKDNLKFYANFNLNTAGVPYSKKDFDDDATSSCGVTTVPGMSPATNGASFYYSSNNLLINGGAPAAFAGNGFNTMIPDAESYPFTESVYATDGTLKEQSGAGSAFKIKSGHETQYLNATASQEKLDRLFGNEIGYGEHYREKAVIDPNGQISVSFENLSGKVVATCMRGESPANLKLLGDSPDTEPYMTPETIYEHFESDYDPASEAFVTQKNFMVTNYNSPYDFDYVITPQQFHALCNEQDYACKYLVEITVTDDCGNAVAESSVTTGPSPALNSPHAVAYTGSNYEMAFRVNFPKNGIYKIEKRLSLDEHVLDSAATAYEAYLRNPANTSCITSLADLIATNESHVDMTECMSCAQNCTAEAIANNITEEHPYTVDGHTFTDTASFIQYCTGLCQPAIPAKSCDGLLAALKDDVSPGGQYFEKVIHNFGSYTFPGGGVPFVEALIDINAVSSVYIVSDWNAYNTAHTYPPLPGTVDYANLTAGWDPTWADYLVQYHPEYCRWQGCVKLSTSYDFDASLYSLNYIQATDAGSTHYYMNVSTTPVGTSVLNSDPYFSTIGSVPAISPSDYTLMAAQISSCSTCTAEFGCPTCGGTITPPTTGDMWSWAAQAPVVIPSTGLTTAQRNEAQWQNFIKLYEGVKLQYLKSQECPAIPDHTLPAPDGITDAMAVVSSPAGGSTFQVTGLHINDPDATDAFQTTIDHITTGIEGGHGTDSVEVYNHVPTLCTYSTSTVTINVTPGSEANPVEPSGVGYCTAQTKCDLTYAPPTPAAGETAVVFYVKINQVPVNYPLDNTLVNWSHTGCYMQISNPVNLPDITSSTSIADVTAYLVQIRDAINNYVSAPYDFMCSITPPTTTGGTYHYTITAPEALGPALAVGTGTTTSNVFFTFTYTSHDTADTSNGALHCLNQIGDGFAFTKSAVNCDTPAPSYVQSCLCVQMRQASDYYSTQEGGVYIVDHTTYPTVEDYIYGNLSTQGITASLSDVTYWLRNCNATGNLSPLALAEDGTVLTTGDNTSHVIPQELKCEDVCQQQGMDEADYYAQEEFDAEVTAAVNSFREDYKKACMNSTNLQEKFNVTYSEREYHYTLYYYDQAGNLVRTVPPTAVQRLGSSMYDGSHNDLVQYARVHESDVTPPAPIYPGHSRVAQTGGATTPVANLLVTNYKYNTLNQLVQQETPDGGLSNFWYSDIGQLRFSQNAKQVAVTGVSPEGRYSYTQYDGQGRIAEVGENDQRASAVVSGITVYLPFYSAVNNMAFPTTNGAQVTKTYYDAPISGSTLTQNYLRKRVAAVTIEDAEDGSDLTYNNATFYSYDVHGNVNTLYQDFPDLAVNGNEFKKIDYTYDLVSGNVNSVSYQAGQYDQFYHRYAYDANNRITHVYTSSDNIHWQQDARYFYYLHGPLARTEIGEDKVQGLDYAYTLQGWVKAVNSNTIGTSTATYNYVNDAGADGYNFSGSTYANTDFSPTQAAVHQNTGRDVFGYSLSYFANDYKAIKSGIGGRLTGSMETSAMYAATPDLYNGNIKAMVTAMCQPVASLAAPSLSEIPTMARFFKYDQLNRIKAAESHTVTSDDLGTITASLMPSGSDYFERFQYDGNGNILGLKRNGYAASGAAGMDDMTYHYANATQNNQLTHVTDAVASTNYTTDIDSQTVVTNYTYDAIGNLTGDAAEGITNIDWTVYGKIHKIYKATYNLEFTYNASGERVEKIMKPVVSGVEKTQEYWTYTYYVRDAQGNVLSVYDRQLAVDGPAITDHLDLQESHIYGSSRLGLVMEDPERNSITPGATAHLDGYNADGTMIRSSIVALAAASAYAPHNTMGNKRYELSNHLGNVNVVISDRKLAVDDGSYNASGITDFYIPEVVSSQDYYSFGAEMPGRIFAGSTSYRYKFNGKENDSELKGEGNSYAFEQRIYDPRLGRFLSVDPLEREYVWNSPYSYAENKLGLGTDREGAELQWIKSALDYTGLTPELDKTTAGKVFNRAAYWYSTEPLKDQLVSEINKSQTERVKQVLGGQVYVAYENAQGTAKTALDAAHGKPEAIVDMIVIAANTIAAVGTGIEAKAPEPIAPGVLEENTTAVVYNAVSNSPLPEVQEEVSTVPSFAEQVYKTAEQLKASGKAPAAIAGAELPNGATAIESSGAPPSIIDAGLKQSADALGGVGAVRNGNTVGCCAEFQAANKVLLENPGYKPSDLKITPAIRPKTGDIVPRCTNCQDMFGP